MVSLLHRSNSMICIVQRSCLARQNRVVFSDSIDKLWHQNRFCRRSLIHTTPSRLATVKQDQLDPSNRLGDSQRMVTAYNLSEELKIEDGRRLLDKLQEYQLNEMPHDVQKEALMLSLKVQPEDSDIDNIHDIFIFREGTVVFWGVPSEQQRRVLYSLSNLKVDPHSSDLTQKEKEQIRFELDDVSPRCRLNRDVVELSSKKGLDSRHLDQLACSHAVALSVKLAIWEAVVDKFIDSVGYITNKMKNGKNIQLTSSEIFRKTGELYELKHRIILDSDLLDLPDIYWDRHDQEILFLSLVSFLNIRRRTSVIDEKLKNCCELMNLLTVHINEKHHIRLEWMIIVLIMVEVLFEVNRFVRDGKD